MVKLEERTMQGKRQLVYALFVGMILLSLTVNPVSGDQDWPAEFGKVIVVNGQCYCLLAHEGNGPWYMSKAIMDLNGTEWIMPFIPSKGVTYHEDGSNLSIKINKVSADSGYYILTSPDTGTISIELKVKRYIDLNALDTHDLKLMEMDKRDKYAFLPVLSIPNYANGLLFPIIQTLDGIGWSAPLFHSGNVPLTPEGYQYSFNGYLCLQVG
jgi:hypothetical protein